MDRSNKCYICLGATNLVKPCQTCNCYAHIQCLEYQLMYNMDKCGYCNNNFMINESINHKALFRRILSDFFNKIFSLITLIVKIFFVLFLCLGQSTGDIINYYKRNITRYLENFIYFSEIDIDNYSIIFVFYFVCLYLINFSFQINYWDWSIFVWFKKNTIKSLLVVILLSHIVGYYVQDQWFTYNTSYIGLKYMTITSNLLPLIFASISLIENYQSTNLIGMVSAYLGQYKKKTIIIPTNKRKFK